MARAREADAMKNKLVQPVPRRQTVKQAATYTGLSVWTLRRFLENGWIPYMQPSGLGGHILINTADLDRFLDAATMPATAGPLFSGGGS
jgi:excisionase family DNA binding protein